VGVAMRMAPSGQGRWAYLELPRSGPRGHLASATITPGESPGRVIARGDASEFGRTAVISSIEKICNELSAAVRQDEDV
jgi:hypothetical protein